MIISPKSQLVWPGSGAETNALARAQDFQRKTQFYLVFVEAENSSGFPRPAGNGAQAIAGEGLRRERLGR